MEPDQRKLRTLGKSVADRVFREHPTLFLTMAYLGLTFVGMIHDLWFYFYFRINILDFSETGDFLLAAIRNPLVIILSILPLGILLLFHKLRDIARKKSTKYDAYAAKYENSKWNGTRFRLPLYGVFVLIYAILFTQLYAQREADSIKAGKGRRISFARSDGITPGEKPILLGATTKFFFLYYPARREAEVVPIDNTALITVDTRGKKVRQKDSLAAISRSRQEPRQ